MIREAKRTSPAYRPHAMAAFAEFVEVHKNADLFEQTHALVAPVVEEALASADRMDLDGDGAADARVSKTQ